MDGLQVMAESHDAKNLERFMSRLAERSLQKVLYSQNYRM